MCIFFRDPSSVTDTKIFVTILENGRQFTVYQNQVGESGDNAMVLPVPIISGVKNQIELIDLSGYREIFDDLGKMFRDFDRTGFTFGAKGGMPTFSSTLEIKTVGDYNVSIAECLDDLDRVSGELIASEGLKELLRTHYEHGFAFLICKIKKGGKLHPIAYESPVINNIIFAPTRHEHGTTAPLFDHVIYSTGVSDDSVGKPLCGCKGEVDLHKYLDKEKLPVKLGKFQTNQVRRLLLRGSYTNQDTYFYPRTGGSFIPKPLDARPLPPMMNPDRVVQFAPSTFSFAFGSPAKPESEAKPTGVAPHFNTNNQRAFAFEGYPVFPTFGQKIENQPSDMETIEDRALF